MRCKIRWRSMGGVARQSSNASAAAFAAASISAAPPAATSPRSIPSIGEWLMNVAPEALKDD